MATSTELLPTTEQYLEAYEFAKTLAVQCGTFALTYYKECGGAAAAANVKIETKANINDLVTDGDKAVEDFFANQVKTKFPLHLVLGEETTAIKSEKNALNSDADEPTPSNHEKSPINLNDLPTNPIWIVDPIDGTTNFVHGFQHWCISIGYVHNGQVIFGVIYKATTDQMWHALKDHGAYLETGFLKEPLNSQNTETLKTKLKVSNQNTIQGSLFASSLAFNYLSLTKSALLNGVHGIRSIGSSALMCCDIASGNCDFYTHEGIHVWDIIAGARIILEAGGYLYSSDFESECDFFSRRFSASCTKELAKDAAEKMDLTVLHIYGETPGHLKRDTLIFTG